MPMTIPNTIRLTMVIAAVAITAEANGCPHVGQRIACELASREHAGHLIRCGVDEL